MYTVRVAPKARTQIRTVNGWWVEHRPYNPSLFREELAAAAAQLRYSPRAAPLYESANFAEVRRVILPRTRYHLYYVVDEPRQSVRVLAIRHAARGAGPAL